MSETIDRIEALKQSLGEDGDPGSIEELDNHAKGFEQAAKTFEVLQHPPIKAFVLSLIAQVQDFNDKLLNDTELLTKAERKEELLIMLTEKKIYIDFLSLFSEAKETKEQIAETINRTGIEKGDE